MEVSEVTGRLSQLLGPEVRACARSSGFCRRHSELTGLEVDRGGVCARAGAGVATRSAGAGE